MSRVALDTRFEDTGEDVFEARSRAVLAVEYRLPDRLRVFASARFDWFVMGAEPLREAFLFYNARNVRWDTLLELRDTYVDFYTRVVDVRVGHQSFTWGQNEGVSPLDMLNPVDLRDLLAGNELMKQPIPAVSANFALGANGSLRLVWAPFFTPNRYWAFGHDFSVLTPGSAAQRAVGDVTRAVDPSLDARLSQALVGTRLPNANPLNSTVGLRLQYQVGPVDLAFVAILGWNRVPELRMDPDLRAVLAANVVSNPQQLVNDPALRDAALRLQQKAQLGVLLADSTFTRSGVVGFDVAATAADFVFKLDFGWSPNVTLYDDSLAPLHRHTLRGALGLEWQPGDWLQVVVAAHGTAVLGVLGGERLLFLEPRFASAARDRVVFFWGVLALARAKFIDDKLRLQAGAAYNPATGDHALSGSAGWHFTEAHALSAQIMFMQGPLGSPFGYFDRNDQAWLQYVYAF